MADINVGSLERVSVTFTGTNGAVADPTAVTCRYRSPAGTETSLTYGVDGSLVKDSTGVYHVDIPCTVAGIWRARFAGTGAVVAAAEDSFTVALTYFQ